VKPLDVTVRQAKRIRGIEINNVAAEPDHAFDTIGFPRPSDVIRIKRPTLSDIQHQGFIILEVGLEVGRQ